MFLHNLYFYKKVNYENDTASSQYSLLFNFPIETKIIVLLYNIVLVKDIIYR
jgi:hypothetical protein